MSTIPDTLCFSIDWYGGQVPDAAPNNVRDTSTNTANPVPIDKATDANRQAACPLSIDMTRLFGVVLPVHIIGWEGAISTFGPIHGQVYPLTDANYKIHPDYAPGMHVDTWLSIGRPTSKMAPSVFGYLKAGDSGSAVGSFGPCHIPIVKGTILYLNYWVHNMRWTPNLSDDWHCGYVIHYIEG